MQIGSFCPVLIILLLLLLLLTAIGLSPSGSGYFTCTQNMKLVTTNLMFMGPCIILIVE